MDTCDIIFVVLICLFILLIVVILLDYLMKITVRKTRKNRLYENALQNARKQKKPLIVFYSDDHGIVVNNDQSVEQFTGDIKEILSGLKKNSCVLVLSEILEYYPDVQELLEIASYASEDIYVSCIEKTATRAWWDKKLLRLMEEPYYLPGSDRIDFREINKAQKYSQKIFDVMFMLFPKKIVVDDNYFRSLAK